VLEVLDIVASWAVTTVLLFVIVNRDERRLTPEQLERAWPVSTKRVAIVLLGVFCLPVHYTRTRRSFLGFCIGMGWMIAVIGVLELVSLGLEAIFDALARFQ